MPAWSRQTDAHPVSVALAGSDDLASKDCQPGARHRDLDAVVLRRWAGSEHAEDGASARNLSVDNIESILGRGHLCWSTPRS